MAKKRDITQTGAMSYRELQDQNNLNSTPSVEQLDYINRRNQRRAQAIASYESGFDIRPTIEKSSLYNQNTGEYWGSSIHDEEVARNNPDLGDIRADNQWFIEKVGNGLAKGALLAGTTFLNGTAGLAMGITAAINEGRFSALWDNDFSRAMQSVNEWSEQVLPNYYSQEELNSPWYTNILSGNFIGDKFIKNLGFTIGAFYSGNVEAAGMRILSKLGMATAKKLGATIDTIKKVSKASSHVASAVGAVTSAVNEGRIEALNNSKEWFELQSSKIYDDYKAKRDQYEALGDYASIEELDRNYDLTMQELEEDRQKMGNADLLMNIPILTASNLFQFGKLYANGFRTGRRASNIVGNLTEGYAGKTTRAAGIRKAIGNALSEGTEEITQKMASTISGDYYEDSISNFYNAKVNPEAEQKTVDWIKSFAQGINETVNEGSSWEEFFIGSLTGALGMPMFRSARGANGKFRSPVTLQGGIIGELKENKEQMEREARIADYMNKRVQDPKFRNYYQGLTRHEFYQAIMDDAVKQGKEFDFKNAEFVQFLSDINMFDNAGKLEDLMTLIESAYDISEENLRSIYENTTRVVTAQEQTNKINELIQDAQSIAQEAQEKGDIESLNWANNQIQQLSIALSNVKDTSVGPFVDDKGNPMYSTHAGQNEMIEKISSTRNGMISQIDNYIKTKQEILESVGESITDDQLSELIFLKTQVDNWQERAKNMTGDVMNILKGASATFRNIHDPSKGEESDYSQVIESINDLLTKTPEEATAILTNPRNHGFVDALSTTLNIFGANTINGLKKQEALNKLNDLKKIGTSIEVYNKKFEEYIKNPSKQAQRQAKETQQQQENQNTKDDINQLDNINNSSVSDIVRQVDEGSIDFDRIEGLLGGMDIEGAEEARTKVNDAKDIIDTYDDSISRLEDMLSRGEINEQQRDDAVSMLNDSKRKAEKGDDVLDVESESYNDFRLLKMEEDNAAIKEQAEKEGWSEDETNQALDEIRNKRIDTTKGIIRRFADERNEKKESLSRLPEGITSDESQPSDGSVGTESIPSPKEGQTGHDSVDKNEPVNKPSTPQNTELTNSQMSDKMLRRANLDPSRNQQIARAITNILDYVDTALKKGMKAKDIRNLVLGTSSWKKVTQGGPKLMKVVIDDVNYKFKNRSNPVEEQEKKPESTDEVQTPLIPVEIINNQIEEQNKASYDMTGVSKGPDGKYHYWRSGTTEYKIHREKGDNSPYWTTMPASVRDMYKEIHDFLKSRGAFDRVRNNQVKEGDIVYFAISKELNQKAGVPVILMTDSQGNIIGNLPIPNDSTFNDYIGLADFYNEVVKDINDGKITGDNDIVMIPGRQSKVSRNLIGKPQYTNPNERHTLNEINTVESSEGNRKSVPFKLGIAIGNKGSNALRIMATPGRSQNQGTSKLEQKIQQPLSMVHGQPFLLMPTSSNRDKKGYVTVPIMMPVFDINNPAIANSALGKEVITLVNELATISTNKDKLMAWADRFKELMAYEEVYVDVDSVAFEGNTRSEKFVVRVKNSKTDAHWTTLYSGNQADCVNPILNNLSQGNAVFNVNRKYINTTYKGKDYNRMIGELAETNLPIGATHTINDWFTIDPIVAGRQEKAKNPKSTKTNPDTTQGSRTTVKDNKGNIYYLTSSNRLYKENPNGHDPELIDPKYNNIKAHAWGVRMNEPMTRPYQSPWGMYNPQTGKFEDIEERPVAINKIEGPVADQIKESSSRVSFNESDHSYTVNGQPIDMSVTQYVHRNDKIEDEAPGVLGYLELSGRIGTEVDKILRNYFEGKVYNSPLFTAKQNRYVREQARKLKDSLDTMFGKGSWKAITDENMLRVSGVIQTDEGLKTIAGTMDMLIQDKDGNFHIIDFKTKRSNVPVAIGGNNKVNYDSQVTLYAVLAQANNPLLRGKIMGSYLAVFNPFYQTPKGSRSNEIGNMTYTEQNGSIIATDLSLGGKVINLHETQGFNPGTFSQLQGVDWNNDMVASVKGNIKSTRNTAQSNFGQENISSNLNSKSNAEIRAALDNLLEKASKELSRSDTWKDNIKQGLFTRYFKPEKAKPIRKNDGTFFTIDDCVNSIKREINEIVRLRKQKEDFKAAMGPGYLGTDDGLRGIGASTQVSMNRISEYLALAYVLLSERESQPSTQATDSSKKDTVGASPVALSYLLENGVGTIESAGYFLHAVAAAFPAISNRIEDIRNSIGSDKLGMKPNEYVSSNDTSIESIRSLINETYGKEGNDIFNELLKNSTGFLPKIGNEVAKRIEGLKPVSKPIEVSPVKQAVLNESSREESIALLKDMGILNKKERESAVEKLSDDRLAKAASMKKLKLKQLFDRFDAMVRADMTDDEVNQVFDNVSGAKPLNRIAEQEIQEANNWSMESELKRIRKILPQLSQEGRIKLVEGLIKIAESKDPQFAYGQFQNGIITLSSESARGTIYHEAFHFVSQTLLSPEELMKLYQEYGITHSLNKTLEIEESLAEDFRRYMQSYEDGNVFSNAFRTLKHIIKNLFGKSNSVDNLFYNIRRGKLANRSVSQDTVNMQKNNNYRTDREQSKVIQQYHRQKLDYGNLNTEQKNYLDLRGISIEEYNSMTPQEKEVLFRCM